MRLKSKCAASGFASTYLEDGIVIACTYLSPTLSATQPSDAYGLPEGTTELLLSHHGSDRCLLHE
jgi:hypothetical protein